jgi:glycosyltransferase involved in cell wall biosynthesis
MKKTVGCTIPVHNRADLIIYSLRSLLAQTHKPDRVIVIDDASTDRSADVVRLFADKHPELNLEVHTVEKQSGVGAVLKIGMSYLADYDLVFSVASDDHVSANYIESALETFNSHDNPMLGVSYPEKVVYFASSFEKNKMPVFEKMQTFIMKDWDNNSLAQLKVHNNFLNGSSILCRKAYEDVGGYEDYDIYDYHFWLKLCLSGYIGAQMPSTYFYRQHFGQVSQKRSQEQRAKAFDIIWQDMRKRGLS